MSLDFTAINPAAAKAGETSSPGDLPSRAQYVVVGGGVIGTSIAYHLALHGASDVVLLERKQLTSGTTWHAAGEVVSGGTTEDALWMARYSAELYAKLEAETGLSTGFRTCGYLQLATTERRDEAYRRETAYMRSVGMTKEVLSPGEVAEMVPMMRTDDVIHGFWTPDEGRANPVDVTMSLAKGARQRGVRIFEETEVTGFVLDGTRVTGVRTERGDIDCEKVVLAAGLWGRELAAKAGVTVPLQAAEHYYLLTEPIAGITAESVPVIEEPEAYGYYREEGGGLLVGMFEPVGKAWSLDGTPRESAFAVLPPDWDRLAPFLEVAMRRFPALEDAGIRTLFCGPESFTDDLSPMLGESPEVDGLYLACGLNSVGILSGGGLGNVMAQWLIEEHPPIDLTSVGVDRAHEFQATRLFRQERTVERLGFLLNNLSWPNAQNMHGRGVRRSPYHPQHVADGAHFATTSGWEYPAYFAGPGVTPTVEWGYARGEAFERTGEEHRHARESFAIFDMSLMSHHLVRGPHATTVLNRVCANDIDTAVGRIVYTQWLDDRGGIIADVTVTRLADDQYVVVGGDNIHRRISAWLRRQTRDGEFVTVTDVTSGQSLLSVQGPRSRELLQRLSPDDWSNDAFPYLTAQKVELGYTPLWALRVTYVGELGWDLLVPTEFGSTLYDQLREAGADLGFRPTGVDALSTMRLEKAYRDMGHDIDSTDTPLEAGLGFAVSWDKPGGFVGRDALLKQKEAGPPAKRLVNVLLGSPDHDLIGDEPVYWDDKPLGLVRAGGFGHSLGASCGIAELRRDDPITPADIAAGTFEIDVAGTRVPATVSLKPLFDPQRTRILC
ncbi:MAG TPA: FAD-dependent oxidoreductase [Nocardioides sp.]|jgi:4-methylaminobutanoate oxidase (formaldehyde-forming)|uniref:FAD-dependent oxidoreductase n=1 Tax=Nocardioides sp. TaxID=35761 RepID=UPI002E32BBD6|nr:FAD-dependent oxidoreductase [Nocardioides sp.]HEX3931946.1 FAD-dependent oxidoreductase [Nocardioides sp.]